MGFRPSTPDTRPILGEMAGAEGVYFASGGSHVGMTLGPVMGRITADLVAGRDPGINLDPYRPDRW
jgi:D-amino-acid dehydrogenase